MKDFLAEFKEAVKKPSMQVFIIAFACATMPSVVNAATGGGGGVFSGLLGYIQSSVVDDLVDLAIIGLAILMMMRHFSILAIAGTCAGVWAILNASTIRAWF